MSCTSFELIIPPSRKFKQSRSKLLMVFLFDYWPPHPHRTEVCFFCFEKKFWDLKKYSNVRFSIFNPKLIDHDPSILGLLSHKCQKQGGHRYWKNLKILEYTGKKYWYLIILEVLKKCPFFQYILENDKLEYLKILEFYFSIKSSIFRALSGCFKVWIFQNFLVGPNHGGSSW